MEAPGWRPRAPTQVRARWAPVSSRHPWAHSKCGRPDADTWREVKAAQGGVREPSALLSLAQQKTKAPGCGAPTEGGALSRSAYPPRTSQHDSELANQHASGLTLQPADLLANGPSQRATDDHTLDCSERPSTQSAAIAGGSLSSEGLASASDANACTCNATIAGAAAGSDGTSASTAAAGSGVAATGSATAAATGAAVD